MTLKFEKWNGFGVDDGLSALTLDDTARLVNHVHTAAAHLVLRGPAVHDIGTRHPREEHGLIGTRGAVNTIRAGHQFSVRATVEPSP